MTSTMLAVSDTSPISNLAAIGRLDLLHIQFPELWIPNAVATELNAHPDPVALAAINAALSGGWMRIAKPPDTPLLRMLQLNLDLGEAHAIALAVDLTAGIIVIDEQEGRRFAAQAGLSFTGTLGILLRAKRSGHIPALRPEVEALRVKARFFLSSSLESEILAVAGE